MKNEQERRGIVAAALSWTKTTTISPSHYEKQLLQRYIQGTLSIDQVIELLEENSSKQAD